MAWSVERKLEVKTLWWVFIVTLAIGGTAYAFATSGAQTVLVLLSMKDPRAHVNLGYRHR